MMSVQGRLGAREVDKGKCRGCREEMGVVNLRGCVEFRGIGRGAMAAHTKIRLPSCHRLPQPQPLPNNTGLAAPFLGQGFCMYAIRCS